VFVCPATLEIVGQGVTIMLLGAAALPEKRPPELANS
jgi:hypothetical protein